MEREYLVAGVLFRWITFMTADCESIAGIRFPSGAAAQEKKDQENRDRYAQQPKKNPTDLSGFRGGTHAFRVLFHPLGFRMSRAMAG